MFRPKLKRTLDVSSAVTALVAIVGLLYRSNVEIGLWLNAGFVLFDFYILLLIAVHDVVRLLAPRREGDHVGTALFTDLVAIVPLAAGLHASPSGPSVVLIVRQTLYFFMVLRRTERGRRLIAALNVRPAHILIGSFAAVITVGTLLLWLPSSTVTRGPLPLIDALFTATSATCVTGLIVRDTGKDFTVFGQLVILSLIQVGGLGIMTFSVWVLIAAGQTLRKRHELIMQTVLDQEAVAGIVNQIRFIFQMTLLVEAGGALALFLSWRQRTDLFEGQGQALYGAVFHSVSAFCNAGFSLFTNSLMAFRGNLPVNLTIGLLIVIGGLGFFVVRDLWRWLRRTGGMVHGLSMQTRVVLAATTTLIVGGAALLFAAESNHLLTGVPWHEQILTCVFQAVTARTAGFNTVDIGGLHSASRLLLIVLMFIGASPGSTGGGIKTTTFWILLHHAVSGMRGRGKVEIARRSLPIDLVQKAASIGLVSAAFLFSGTFVIMLMESLETGRFSDILFEAASALGTVGLTTGITATLSTAGKAVIIALMFAGRLGPLTIALALAGGRARPHYEYAEERIAVG